MKMYYGNGKLLPSNVIIFIFLRITFRRLFRNRGKRYLTPTISFGGALLHSILYAIFSVAILV